LWPTSLPLFQGSRRPVNTAGFNILNCYCLKGVQNVKFTGQKAYLPVGRSRIHDLTVLT
jgi:hypothetical protein